MMEDILEKIVHSSLWKASKKFIHFCICINEKI